MTVRVTSCAALLALAIGGGQTPEAAAAPSPGAPAAAAMSIDSVPVALLCGQKPLALPVRAASHGAPADKPLARQKPIAVCTNLASAAAVCTCLATNVAKWTDALHAPATCKPSNMYKGANAQVLEVTSTPGDPDATGPGTVLVLAAQHGATWSPAGLIDISSEIDRATAPKQSGIAAIDRFEQKPAGDGTLVWIESRHETEETEEGTWSRDGEASTTICSVSAAAAPFCYVGLPRATWMYDEDVIETRSSCKIESLATYAQHFDGAAVAVTLAHGADLKPVGRYKLQ